MAKALGINLGAVYFSDAKMFLELREASQDGLTRIEISYYAADFQQEQELN